MITSNRSTRHGLAGREVRFTADQARRALPYMLRLARDAAKHFHAARQCRHALAHAHNQHEAVHLMAERDAAVERLNSVIDEANAVGADLLDIPRGVVRFLGIDNGRKVIWLWTLGDPISGDWPLRLPAEVSDKQQLQAAAS